MHAGNQLLLLPPARPLGERLGREFFRTVPPRPGVYLMCGHGDGVLYVGKAKNLRQRLGNYRSANTERLSHKLRRLLLVVERIHWDECATEAAALAREARLLLALRPRFNTVGVYPAPVLRLGWEMKPDGFALGAGEVVNEFASQSEPLRRLRPAYGALLRLTWGAWHPESPLHTMPSRLTGERPPVLWQLPERRSFSEELAARLADFFTGRSGELADWLVTQRNAVSKFEQTWQAQDAEALREFYTKLPALKVKT